MPSLQLTLCADHHVQVVVPVQCMHRQHMKQIGQAAVSLTQPFPLVLWVVVAAILIQQLENNFLVPRISGTAVGLHPLAALLAVLVGAEIGGVVGAIFAVPLTGLAWSIARAIA